MANKSEIKWKQKKKSWLLQKWRGPHLRHESVGAFHSICTRNLSVISVWFTETDTNHAVNNWDCVLTAVEVEPDRQSSELSILSWDQQAKKNHDPEIETGSLMKYQHFK